MKPSLEQRVAALERQLMEMQAQQTNGPAKDAWRHTAGMFSDNPGMLDIFAEAMKFREADRKKTRQQIRKR